MEKKEKYVDIGILGFLGLIIAFSLNNYFQGNVILSVNTYLGIGFWAVAIFLVILGNPKAKYLLLATLFLYTLNIINFSAMHVSMTVGNLNDEAVYQPVSFNPIGAVLMIIYWIGNKKFIRGIYTPTDDEHGAQQSKMIAFYEDKFELCTKEEISELYKHYNSYPVEAQVVLDKLMKEN